MFPKSLLVVLLGVVAVWADDEFSATDLEKGILGSFSKCNGEIVQFPIDHLIKGLRFVSQCQNDLKKNGITGSKACLGLCIGEYMGLINEDRSYNIEKAVKPLNESVYKGLNNKEIVEIQANGLRYCTEGLKFVMKEGCPASRAFNVCIRKKAKEDCGDDSDETVGNLPAPALDKMEEANQAPPSLFGNGGSSGS